MAHLRLKFNIHFDHRHAAMIYYAARRSGITPVQLLELIVANWFGAAEELSAAEDSAGSDVSSCSIAPEEKRGGQFLLEWDRRNAEAASGTGEIPIPALEVPQVVPVSERRLIAELELQRAENEQLRAELWQAQARIQILNERLERARDSLDTVVLESTRRTLSANGMLQLRAAGSGDSGQ